MQLVLFNLEPNPITELVFKVKNNIETKYFYNGFEITYKLAYKIHHNGANSIYSNC